MNLSHVIIEPEDRAPDEVRDAVATMVRHAGPTRVYGVTSEDAEHTVLVLPAHPSAVLVAIVAYLESVAREVTS